MAEKVAFYFRGPTPSLEISEAFVRDLKIVLDLPVENLRRIGDELAGYGGFLSAKTRDEIISRCLENDSKDVSSRLVRAIRFGELLQRRDQDRKANLLSQLEQWQQREENSETVLTSEEFLQLKDRLPLVIREYPSRLRQEKAERLAEATGLRADSIDLICDLRPVLDDSRSQIIGFIPITTLRVVASGVDRFPISFETILSAKDVQDLLKTAEFAVKKLNTLGEFAAQSRIRIPAVGLTETVDHQSE
jgi:hypothetical protein